MKNQKVTWQNLDYGETLKNVENKKHTLQDLEKGENSEKPEKQDMHTVGPRLWRD